MHHYLLAPGHSNIIVKLIIEVEFPNLFGRKYMVDLVQVIDYPSVSYNASVTDCSDTQTLPEPENRNSEGSQKPSESGELKLKLGYVKTEDK